jgi:hypothetical protein
VTSVAEPQSVSEALVDEPVEAAAPVEPKKAKKTARARDYLVLSEHEAQVDGDPALVWLNRGVYSARDHDEAIRAAATVFGAGVYTAVPQRSWKVARVKFEVQEKMIVG